MHILSSDPMAALVHLRIEELRREAAADALASTARDAGPRRSSWPASVASALRESFARATASRPPTATESRRGEPCPTC
ncbi:MAG: hypothetical protein ACRDWY_01530 [Actinomycetes bacterium]